MIGLMDELTEEQIAELQQDVIQLKSDLERELVLAKDTAKPVDLDQPIGRLSRMDAMQNQQIAKASKKNTELRLRLILAAINSLEDGDYGLCVRCDCPIAFRRLKARPEARMCIECARETERR